MADIRPFRALRYNPAEVPDLATVLTPPYDVITDEQRDRLYARSPHNFVRVDLARPEPGDAGAADRYARATQVWNTWRRDGVVTRDPAAALYVYDQAFATESGARMKRRGFLALVRLHEYSDRVVLPHERTLAGPRADRLELMKQTRAQLSQIFMLYDDPRRAVATALDRAVAPLAPIASTTTDDGIEHALFAVTDDATISQVRAALAQERLLIADGHHRYETALEYLRLHRTAGGAETESDDPHAFVLTYLVASNDPGIAILPTHRAVHSLTGFDFGEWLAKLRPWFHVESLDATLAPGEVTARLAASSALAPSFVVIGPPHGSEPGSYLLRFDRTAGAEVVRTLDVVDEARDLDLTLLHDFVFARLTGISPEAQAAKTNIHYIKGLDAALAAVSDPAHQLVVLMHPVSVDRVRRICEAGGFMPQKSTFFHPKVASGLVMADLEAW